MARIDEIHAGFPCYGARKLSRVLRDEGLARCPGRVVPGLMAQMGARAACPGPRAPEPGKAGKFPYLLAGKPVTHPNQVRPADVACVRPGRPRACPGAAIGRFGRHTAARRPRGDVGARNPVGCTGDAFRDHGVPSIANSDYSEENAKPQKPMLSQLEGLAA